MQDAARQPGKEYTKTNTFLVRLPAAPILPVNGVWIALLSICISMFVQDPYGRKESASR